MNLFRRCQGMILMFVLLACLVGLAGPVQASYYVTIPFVVRDEAGNDLENCQIYLWEKFPYNNWPASSNAMTDASGAVSIPLTLSSTVSDKDLPGPNLGYLVLPDPTKPTQASVAFAIGETRFFFPQTDAANPARPAVPVQVTLRPGKMLQINVLNAQGQPYGQQISGNQNLTINAVPYNVFAFSVATNTYTGLWPADQRGAIFIPGDNKANDPTAASYTLGVGKDFKIDTNATATVVDLTLEEQSKARVAGSITGGTSGSVELSSSSSWTAWDVIRGTINSDGTYEVWLVPGRYYLRVANVIGAANHIHPFVLDVRLEGLTVPQIAMAPGVDLGGTLKAALNSDQGNPVPVPNYSSVFLQQAVNFDGQGEVWLNESLNTYTDGMGVYRFSNLEPGKYRLSTTNSQSGLGYSKGWVRKSLMPWRSFADVPAGDPINLQAEDLTQDLVMAETGALFGIAQTEAGAAIPSIGNSKPVQFLAQHMDPQVSVGIYDWSMVQYSDKYFFLGFMPMGSQIVTRLQYPVGETVPNTPDVVYEKLTAPTMISMPEVLDLTMNPIVVDPANYVDLKGKVYPGPRPMDFGAPLPPPLESGRVFLYGNPMGFAPILMQEWGLVGTPEYSFKVEKGASYFLVAAEKANVNFPQPPLESGFAKTIVPAMIPGILPGAEFPMDIWANPGSVLFGDIKVDGVKLAGTDVRVTIKQVGWNNVAQPEMVGGMMPEIYPPDVKEITERSGIVSSGSFRISGLNPGQYQVFVDFNGLDPAGLTPPHKPFPFGQATPLVSRQAFIDVPGMLIPFDIDWSTDLIGFLKGRLRDETGAPIPGALVRIQHGMGDDNDGAAFPGAGGAAAFFCVTDEEGVLRKAEGNSIPTDLIPLEPEAGYELYVVGMATPPVGFAYDFAANRTFNIYPNQPTTIEPRFPRVFAARFDVDVLVDQGKRALAFAQAGIQGLGGMQMREGYANEQGTILFDGGAGLMPGSYTLWIRHIDQETRQSLVYSHAFFIGPNPLAASLTIDPAGLANVELSAVTQDNKPLPYASLEIKAMIDPLLGLQGPLFTAGWMSAGEDGMIRVMMPKQRLALFPQLTYVYEPDATGDYQNIKFYPPPPQIVDLASGTGLFAATLQYQRAPVVRMAVVNPPPAADQASYLGLLIPAEHFGMDMTLETFMFAGEEFQGHGDWMPPGYIEGLKLGRMVDGVLTFEGVTPYRRYVPVAYQFNGPVGANHWDLFPPMPVGEFRYCGPAFDVAGGEVQTVATFPTQLSVLKITADPPELADPNARLQVLLTRDPAETTGQQGIPVRFSGPEPMLPSWGMMGVEFLLPERAYRVAYLPGPMSPGLAKVDENVLLVGSGTQHVLRLKGMQKLTVDLTNGVGNDEVALIPDGAVFGEGVEPIEGNASGGQVVLYMPPGPFVGYAIPATGTLAPTMMEVFVQPYGESFATVTFPLPQKIVGQVGVASGAGVLPLPNARLEVFRKRYARSDLVDGLPLFPYPAWQGEHEVTAGVDGRFEFVVEPNVDYYVLPIAPAGFLPQNPIRVSVADADVVMDNILHGRADGAVTGTVNTPAMIHVVPMVANAVTSSVGMMPEKMVSATEPDDAGLYPFSLVGLDKSILYELRVFPQQPGFGSFFRQLRPAEWPTEPLVIDLTSGFSVSGYLADMDGNPLPAANVPVNLATIIEGKPKGFWTMTDAYGKFSFKGVPPTEFSVIKTEDGFVYNSVRYARGMHQLGPVAYDVTDMVIMLAPGGRIIGKLIDEKGQPIITGKVRLSLMDLTIGSRVASDGAFVFDYLPPAPNYKLETEEVPGKSPAFKAGIQVLPESTTDVGVIRMVQSVRVSGMVNGFKAFAEKAFIDGVPLNGDIEVIGVRAESVLNDLDILDNRLMEKLSGFSNLAWQAGSAPVNLPFQGAFQGGMAHLGVTLGQNYDDGSFWRTFAAWRQNVAVPTFEQIGTRTHPIGDLAIPDSWGSAGGMVTHFSSQTGGFNPGEAVVVFYAVDATTGKLSGNPVPTAVAVPSWGFWQVPWIPAGKYRIKIVTRKFASWFLPESVEIKSGEFLMKDLTMGNSVFRVFGSVVASETAQPLEGARVVLNGDKVTTTNMAGEFEFFEVPNAAFVVNLVVDRPGYKTQRILRPQQELAAALDLGQVLLSGAVASFRGTVVASGTGEPLAGAQARLIYRDATTNFGPMVFGGDVVADETGLFVFSTMPTDRVATISVRMPGYQPTMFGVEQLSVGQTASRTIEMDVAPLQVFYQGFMNETGAPDTYHFSAFFNFSRPVATPSITLSVNGVEVPPTFPAGFESALVLFFDYTNESLVLTGEEFDVVVTVAGIPTPFTFKEKATKRFSRTFDVDPLDPNGFEKRATDEEGNQLPVGLKIPAGLLDEDIASFSLREEVGSGPIEFEGGVATGVAFAGPKFSFDFGKRIGSTSAVVENYLFEVTIKYTATDAANLEPRWYDSETKTWSKVGILPGSVKWDAPEVGYVSFKVTHLTDFAVFSGVADTATGLRCDLNGDGKVDLNDVVFMWAYQQLEAFSPGAGDDSAAVNRRATALRSGVEGSLMYRPSITADDINGDSVIDLNDVVFLWAWQQLESFVAGSGSNSTNLMTRARNLRSSVVGSPVVQPNIRVSRQ